MSSISESIDVDALGKLLTLAKSMDGIFQDKRDAEAGERVLIRTTSDGHLAFQVKGGTLWRFFTITLSGREKEYDLGQNFAQLQALFHALKEKSDSEIRRAAQGMAMYGQTVIDTKDAIATLTGLQSTLNSIIEHVKRKKMRQALDEERKKSIIQALDAMKIDWRPMESTEAPQQKKTSRKKV
ncbi:MAG: hypothetical protein JSR46_06580 [Verrucomicrobia bacterium]|nr:hypothetical protein [Verrucomicrobiota bacterium]